MSRRRSAQAGPSPNQDRWSRWPGTLLLLLLLAAPVQAGDFDCADPGDIDPGETDVVVTKDFSIDEIEPGERFTYTIQVHNCGPEAAIDLSFFDEVPVRFIFYSIEQTAGPTFDIDTPQVGVVLDEIGELDGFIASMPVGETAVFEVVVALSYL